MTTWFVSNFLIVRPKLHNFVGEFQGVYRVSKSFPTTYSVTRQMHYCNFDKYVFII